MTVCIPAKGVYIAAPGFFPCRAGEVAQKMAALRKHVKKIEQIQALYRQQMKEG